MASMPKRNFTPSAFQASSRSVCVKSVSPRRVMRRKPASRQRWIANSTLVSRALVRRPIAEAVDDADHLAGVGQREDQRLIAPGVVVGDVDPLLAAGPGRDERAVGVEDGLVEELGRSRSGLTPCGECGRPCPGSGSSGPGLGEVTRPI